MASKKRMVAELNKVVSGYLEQLGMREEAKLEFESKANAMIGVDGFLSIWFERMITQFSQILHQIAERRRPEIDLNEPAPEDKVVTAVEDEARSDSHRKRRRVGNHHSSGTKLPNAALRIHESEAGLASASGMPNPNSQVTLVLVVDSDIESG